MKSDLITAQILTISFCIIFSILIIEETKRLKNLITPFILATLPFIIIFPFTNFILIKIGFPFITAKVHIFIAICLITIWLTGYFTSIFFKKDYDLKNQYFEKFSTEFLPLENLIITLAIICNLLLIHKYSSIFKQFGGLSFIGDPRYETIVNKGLLAHLVQLGKILAIIITFIYSISKRKLILLVLLILLLINIALVQVKYHLMFIFIIIFLAKIIDKPIKKQIKLLLYSAIILIITINIFWLILTIAWKTFSLNNKTVIKFFINQTSNYLVGGTIELDRWLLYPYVRPDWTLLLVFKNVANFIYGNPNIIGANEVVDLGFNQIIREVYSNVGTAFGVYYIVGGLPFTLFFLIIFNFITYTIYFYCAKRCNLFIRYINLLLLTLSLLTFFAVYITLLSIYEMSIIFFIFLIINKMIKFNKSFETVKQ